MSCTPNVFAFSRPCTSNMGGIVAIYIADPAAVVAVVNYVSGAISLSAATQGDKPFYKWEVAENSASLEGSAQPSEANNTSFYSYTLTVALNGIGPTTAGLRLLGRLNKLAIVVEYRDGTMDFLGLRRSTEIVGADLVENMLTSGAQRGDRRGGTFTFHLDSLLVAPRVNGNFSNLVNS